MFQPNSSWRGYTRESGLAWASFSSLNQVLRFLIMQTKDEDPDDPGMTIKRKGALLDLGARTLLGTKGIATRSKDATISSWPYY